MFLGAWAGKKVGLGAWLQLYYKCCNGVKSEWGWVGFCGGFLGLGVGGFAVLRRWGGLLFGELGFLGFGGWLGLLVVVWFCAVVKELVGLLVCALRRPGHAPLAAIRLWG